MENCADGDYLAEYRNYLENFIAKVDPDDQLPVKTNGYNILRDELTGEIASMALQYLNQNSCPPSLQVRIIQLVIEEVTLMCKDQPENCGLRPDKAFAPLKLMHIVTGKINEICRRYLDNSRLALLPPPCSIPLTSSCSIKHTRRKMEDRYTILYDLHAMFGIKDESFASYFALFDGHAGQDAAAYSASHLHQYLVENIHYPSDPKRALREAFLKTDVKFLEKENELRSRSGTTAVCALLLGQNLYIAWAGDSQAVLSRSEQVFQLVNPHVPNRKDERKRIKQLGGMVVEFHQIWRVNGLLSVSRSIGDRLHKPFVTAEPEIVSIPLNGSEDFLILGCDGFFDAVTPFEAIAFLFRYLQVHPENFNTASQYLVNLAKTTSRDNISVIVIYLRSPAEILAKAKHPRTVLVHKMSAGDEECTFVVKEELEDSLHATMYADPNRFHFKKPSNGQHENGLSDVEDEENDEDDCIDFGPESTVDDMTDLLIGCDPVVSPEELQKQREEEKERAADAKFQQMMNFGIALSSTDQPCQNTLTDLIPEGDNVADSEDSEDEWNYYRIDPLKDKSSEACTGESAVVSSEIEGEQEKDQIQTELCETHTQSQLLEAQFDRSEDKKEGGILSPEPNNKDISAETNLEEKGDQENIDKENIGKENIEKEHTEKEHTEKENIEKENTDKENTEKENIDKENTDKENMAFHWNPDAAEFFPEATSRPSFPERVNITPDFPISGSPLKRAPAEMNDIQMPSEVEFQNEVSQRPGEVDGDNSFCDIQPLNNSTQEDLSTSDIGVAAAVNLDESTEVSSTKAEFGDESSIISLTASNSNQADCKTDFSFLAPEREGYDIATDPMAMSFTPCDFKAAFEKEVDLNAVHDLRDSDLMYGDTVNSEDFKQNIINDSHALENESCTIEAVEPYIINDQAANGLIPTEPPTTREITDSIPSILSNELDVPVEKDVTADEFSTEKSIQEDEVMTSYHLEVNSSTESALEQRDDVLIEADGLKTESEDNSAFTIPPFGLTSSQIDSTSANDEQGSNKFDFMQQEAVNENTAPQLLSPHTNNFDLLNSTANDSDAPSIQETDYNEYSKAKVEESESSNVTDSINDSAFTSNEVVKDESAYQQKEEDEESHFMELSAPQSESSAVESLLLEQCPKSPESPMDQIEDDNYMSKTIPSEPYSNEAALSKNIAVHDLVEDSNFKSDSVPIETSHVSETVEELTDKISTHLNLCDTTAEFEEKEAQLMKEDIDSETNKKVEQNAIVGNVPLLSFETESMNTALPSSIEKEEKEQIEPTEKDIKEIETTEQTLAETATVAAVAAVAVATATTATCKTAVKPKTPATSSTATKTTKTTKAVTPSTKTTAVKSLPTSPTKTANSVRTSTTSSTAARKSATGSVAATRPKQLDTKQSTTSTSKTMSSAKSTLSSTASTTAMKTSSRVSSLTTKAKATGTATKTSTTEKKQSMTNGEAKISSKSSTQAKTTLNKTANGTVVSKSNSNTLVKTSTTSTRTSLSAERKKTTTTTVAAVAAKSTLKTNTVVNTVTTSRPKTAPPSVSSSTKSRVSSSSSKSPMIDKQIKETANKQISSARSTLATKTTRTSSGTSTTTAKRISSGTTTTTVGGTKSTSTTAFPTKKLLASGKTGVKSTSAAKTNVKSTSVKAKVVQNGVCDTQKKVETIVSTTSEEDVPKKDVSPIAAPIDNQLIASTE